MNNIQNFTAIIEKENDGFVASCPELDIASQGDTVEDAKSNLKEAIELFLEHASKEEIALRLKTDVFITNMQIAVGQA
ncbi:type II toxin-antitoxin system HicB family antitoxin [Parafilimonas sp.]|uniref:type II toxin-antitoxin system HicB family antitoxin n=1 Tax=Parafilimonas sp. TaxID=1969739 RepID=UPI0039E4AC60